MELKGSCHCEKVSFTVTSNTPYPFMYCYCSICRKCQGGGGYAINLGAQYDTLKVEGKEYKKEYRAVRDKATGEKCGNIRHFCGECGSHLYAHDEEWGHLVFPYSSAIDTPLPKVDEDKINHIMLDSKADWVPAPKPDPSKNAFTEYPNMSLEDWHKTFNHYIE